MIGSDLTSDPEPGKPIAAALCGTNGNRVIVERVERLVNFQSFGLLLASKDKIDPSDKALWSSCRGDVLRGRTLSLGLSRLGAAVQF